MRVVSYNINGNSAAAAQAKVDIVLQRMTADVWVLAECFEDCAVPTGYRYYWRGCEGGKGLGVVVRTGLDVQEVDVQEVGEQVALLNYCIPLQVNGCLVVAMWPTRYGDTRQMSYPKILQSNLLALEPLLGHRPTILAGDLNCYVGQSGESRACNIRSINAWLNQRGLVSAYHQTTGEALGEEHCGTLNFRYQGTQFFHIDYIYTNAPIRSFRLAEWDGTDWLNAPIRSDHAPLMLEI